MIRKQLKYSASLIFVVLLVLAVGCGKKKTAASAPPPPDVVTPEPTAEITATPTVVTAGDKVVLAWRTTNANDISIESIGAVSAEGTQTVNPTASINYHLVAKGIGGSADATARVTVNTAAPVVSGNNNADTVDETTFHQNVQDVFYDYDSFELRADAQAIVSKDASFLVAHPTVKVVVGGYCDERGSTEYNLALGENRANAAKQALSTAGISPDRLRAVSYGKEKQFCSAHDENCWQQNRRAQFFLDK